MYASIKGAAGVTRVGSGRRLQPTSGGRFSACGVGTALPLGAVVPISVLYACRSWLFVVVAGIIGTGCNLNTNIFMSCGNFLVVGGTLLLLLISLVVISDTDTSVFVANSVKPLLAHVNFRRDSLFPVWALDEAYRSCSYWADRN